MTAVAWLGKHPEFAHGAVRVGFTTDEEVGHGTDHFDVAAFGAAYAYTLDGSDIAEIEDETFCADSALVVIEGHDVHPGYAKGKLVNAVRVAAAIVERLPREFLRRPRTPAALPTPVRPARRRHPRRDQASGACVHGAELRGREDSESRCARSSGRLSPKRGSPSRSRSPTGTWPTDQRGPEGSRVRVRGGAASGVGPGPARNPRRHRRIQVVIHGAAHAQHLGRRPELPFGAEWVSLGWMAKACEVTLHLLQVWVERSAA